MTFTRRALIIEDDPGMANLLSEAAEGVSLRSNVASTAKAGIERATNEEFDLFIIDLTLPDFDGFELCKLLRAKRPNMPILIVSSRASEVDKVLGLELGADDYVVKPFGQHEIKARMKSLLRRAERITAGESVLKVGEIELDSASRRVTIAGKPIPLTALDFDILWLLASAPDRVFTRDELMQSVWGYNASDFGPSVTAQMSRLRSKIEPDPSKPRYLLTARGVGYRLRG